jgi:hypothetical protein
MPNFDNAMETENTTPVAERDPNYREVRKAVVDGLTRGIEEARTESLSRYMIVDRSDYAPLRIRGRRISLSGEKLFSTNELKQAKEIADKVNAQYRANKIDRHVEVIETLAWRARRVERLVELLALQDLR